MYSKRHLDWLEENGRLSAAYLVRKDKISFEEAVNILNALVEDHADIYFVEQNIIVKRGLENKCNERSKGINCSKMCKKSCKRKQLDEYILVTESYFIDSIVEKYPDIESTDQRRLQRIANVMREMVGINERNE